MTESLSQEQKLFLAADAALREVFDQLKPADLGRSVPAEWTGSDDPTLRDVVAAHARDEAWVPDVLAGKTIDEVGDVWKGDLLGDDPIGNYDRVNDLATAAASEPLSDGQIAHLSYGDFPVGDYLQHVSYYRGFQAWAIAKRIDIPFHMSDELVDLLWASAEPQLGMMRSIHVFPPVVEVPEGSDRETRLLGMTGFWIP